MFDIGWTEIAVVVVVLILVIGPKEIPEVLRTLGRAAGKARSLTREFRSGIDDMVREVDLGSNLPSLEDFRIQDQEAESGEAAMGKENQEAQKKAKSGEAATGKENQEVQKKAKSGASKAGRGAKAEEDKTNG